MCGWRRDDEPLFGESGEAKLIVSVSFGSSALFHMAASVCSDDEAHLCWLDHGDLLVMDGQCQDEFLSSLYESWSGTGKVWRYVPLDQTTCTSLFLLI